MVRLLLFLHFCLPLMAMGIVLSTNTPQVAPSSSFEVEIRFDDFPGEPDPNSLKLDPFEVLNHATSTSVQIVNGATSKAFVIRYQLKAGAEGEFVLGPFQTEVQGQTIRSNSLKIEVVKNPATQASEPLQIKASLSAAKVVFGQQLFYVLKIYRLPNSAVSRISYELPNMQDLILEKEVATQTDTTETLEGQLYQVTEIRVPFFASRNGLVNIPPAAVQYVMRDGSRRGLFSVFDDDFFGGMGGSRRQTFSQNLELQVDPLPEPKPSGFQGLVGQFVCTAAISSEEIKAGENLTLKLSLTGVGSLQDWQAPDLKIEGFKIYPDGGSDLDRRKTTDGRVGGIKTYSFALLAKKQGEFVLGPFEVPYFDPDRGYAVARSEPLRLKVAGGQEASDVSVGPKNTKPQQRELLPIVNDYAAIEPSWPPMFWFVLGLGILFFVLIYEGFCLYRQRFIGDPFHHRRKNALAEFEKKLGQLSFLESLQELVLARLKKPSVSLTRIELCQLLEPKNLPEDLLKRLNQLLLLEEEALYGGKQAQFKPEDLKSCGRELHDLL